MLGLANTVSSSSTPESKYSLTFDGSDDYLDCGLIDFDTDNFSVSCWVKTSNWDNYECIWSNRNTTGQNIGFQLRTNGIANNLALVFDYGGDVFTSTVDNVPADTWFHIVCTVNRSGNQVVYLNNDAEVTTTGISAQSGVSATNALNFFIGKNETNKYHQGKITDLAIWNVSLDADAVEAIYNSGRPTNLTFDSGNYDNSSALVAYYKMGNGSFDDKANGVIHDQNSSGFESSSLYASDYTSGVDGWTGFGDGDVAGNIDSIDGVDNCLRYTSNSTVGDTRAFLKSDVLTIGKVYKVTFSYYIPSGSNVDALFLDTVAGADDDTRNAVTDAWTTVTEYFTALTADIKIILGDENQYLNPATTNDIAYIKDVSVTNQKIGAGFGSEIFANGWDTLNLASPAVNSNGRITVEENHSGLLHKTGHVSDGDVYKVVMDLETYTGGTIYVGGTNVTPTLGLNTYYIRSAGDNTGFGINNPNNFIASNLSVKKLNGLPALTSGGPTFSSDTP